MGIVLDPGAGVGYVADSEHMVDGKNLSKTLSVIDLKTNKVKKQFEVGVGPFDVNIIGNKLFASNATDWTVAVIDAESHKVIDNIKTVDTPLGIAVDRTKNRAYVAIHGKGSVTVIDTSTNKEVSTIKVGKSAWYIAVDPAKNRAYVTRREDNAISIIDTNSNKCIDEIKAGKGPIGIALDPENNRAYVANHEDVSVSIIDTVSNKVVGTIKLSPATDSTYSGSPWGIALY
jgi:YVTN family beta-propeller protein